MESRLVAELRTAAGTAVALDQLARRDARRLLVCGAGAQVPPHVEAIAAIRDLETVQLGAHRRTNFGDADRDTRTGSRTSTQAWPTTFSYRDSGRDLIACLAPATEPYLQLADVRPGITATPALRQPYTRIRHSATTVGLSTLHLELDQQADPGAGLGLFDRHDLGSSPPLPPPQVGALECELGRIRS